MKKHILTPAVHGIEQERKMKIEITIQSIHNGERKKLKFNSENDFNS